MDMFRNMTQMNCAVLGAVIAMAIASMVIYIPKKKHEMLLSKKKVDSSGRPVYDEMKVVAALIVAAAIGAAVMWVAHPYCVPKSSAMGFRFAMESCGCGM